MKNCVICEITNDKFELIVNQWDSVDECASATGYSPKTVMCDVCRYRNKQKKHKPTRFIRVWLVDKK